MTSFELKEIVKEARFTDANHNVMEMITTAVLSGQMKDLRAIESGNKMQGKIIFSRIL